MPASTSRRNGGDQVDSRLSRMEQELDWLEEIAGSDSGRKEIPVNHAALMEELLRRTPDPIEQDFSSVSIKHYPHIPISAIERFHSDRSDSSSLLSQSHNLSKADSRPVSPMVARELRRDRDLERDQRTRLAAHSDSLRRELAGLESQMVEQIRESDMERMSRQAEVNRLRSELKQLEDDQATETLALNAGRESDSRSHARLVASLRDELAKLKQDRESDLNELQLARGEIRSKTHDIEILRVSIADLDQQRVSTLNELNAARSDNSRLREEMDWIRQRLRESQLSNNSEQLRYEIDQLKYIIEAQKRELLEKTTFIQSSGSNRNQGGPSRCSVETLTLPTTSTSPRQQVIQATTPLRSGQIFRVAPIVDVSPIAHITEDPQHIIQSPNRGARRRVLAGTAGKVSEPPFALDESTVRSVKSWGKSPRMPHADRVRSASPTRRPDVVATGPPWAVSDVVPPRVPGKLPVSPTRAAAAVLRAEEMSKVESELLSLNLERNAIESRLNKLPLNSAGRTLAERKDKFLGERRLVEVDKQISELKLRLREFRKVRADPTAVDV